MRQHGIQHITVPPGAHAQNGRVERAHLTILNGVRTLLAQTGLGERFWAEAAKYTTFSRNCAPVGKQKKIPFELWYGNDLVFDKLRTFGERVFFRDHTGPNKLQPRYKEGLFLGYNHDSSVSIYRVYDVLAKKVVVTRDLVLEKTQTIPQMDGNRDVSSFDSKPSPEPTVFQPLPAIVQNSLPPIQKSDITLPENVKQEEPESQPEPVPQPLPRYQLRSQSHNHTNYRSTTPVSSDDGQNSDAESEDPLALTDDPRSWGHHAFAMAALSTQTPQSYLEAIRSGEGELWKSAMKDELGKMEKYNVWTVVDRSKHLRTLRARWVYTRKIDGTTGKPSSYKARWVAKGFSQKAGIDFDELFAAVAHKDSIRVFLSIVNYFDMECDQVDIKAAFLNGHLDETIYLEPPEGSDIPSDKVLLLNKSLYGLRQSSRQFNQALDTWLRSQGLTPTRADSCFYVRRREGETLMLSVHVDDQLIACNSRAGLDDFKAKLNERFECSDSGPAGYFLGFNIHRERSQRKLYISQEHYMDSLLDRFDMTNCNPARNCLPAAFKAIPATDKEHEAARHLPYAQVVGSILYASTITRPDLSHAAGVLSRFISKWSEEHWKAAKHCLRYIRGTSDLCLTFDGESGRRIALGYVDADWGGDVSAYTYPC